MKYHYIISLIVYFLMLSCQNQNTETQNVNDVNKSTEKESLEEIKNGTYTKWHEGKKQILIKGKLKPDNKRDGIWYSYFSDGIKNSMTTYKNGARNGLSWVNYPNGKRHYEGNYKNDTKIGIWKFYSSSGELEEKNMDK